MKSKNISFEKLFVRLAPILMIVAGLLLVSLIVQIGSTRQEVRETSAYTRVSSCIVSKVADSPVTQDAVERCYIQVEKLTNVSLERFDEQTNNENIER